MGCLDGITSSIDMHSSKLRVIMKDREAWRAAVCGVAKRVGHDFEQTPGDNEGQGSLACCSPWGHKELDLT